MNYLLNGWQMKIQEKSSYLFGIKVNADIKIHDIPCDCKYQRQGKEQR